MNKMTLLKREPKRVCASIGAFFLITIAVAADVYGQEDVAAKDLNPLTLWYDQPANLWMTEALPIGNGPTGAMLFGGTDTERIQFNEISLWSGDRMPQEDDIEEENMGAHQAFGDIFIRLGHDQAKVKNYKRQLDMAEHVRDYQSLFGRVSFDLGQTAPELLAKSTLERLETYTNDHSVDPEATLFIPNQLLSCQ